MSASHLFVLLAASQPPDDDAAHVEVRVFVAPSVLVVERGRWPGELGYGAPIEHVEAGTYALAGVLTLRVREFKALASALLGSTEHGRTVRITNPFDNPTSKVEVRLEYR